MFRRGGKAETQARRLAKCFANAGQDACVKIYDARGQLAGDINYFGVDERPEGSRGERCP